jgi:hypothetical protein
MFRRHPPLLAAACGTAAILALAACAGSTPKAPATQEKENEEKLVKFARCLRDHGVNVSIPTESGRGGLRGQRDQPAGDGSGPKRLQALPAFGAGEEPDPAGKVAREEAVLKFAKCMREHGITVHVSAAGGGGTIQLQCEGSGAERGPNPESPAFQAAQKACQGLFPFKGGAGPIPGGTPGGAPSTNGAKGGHGGSGASLALGG